LSSSLLKTRKLLGKGCGSWLILNSSHVECVFIILVSGVNVVNGVDRLRFHIFVHEVDPRPVGTSLGMPTWFIFLDLFLAFFLLVPLNFAEVAEFAILICVVSAA
jgi:hypothetical protein